jgi:hypothetical protein
LEVTTLYGIDIRVGGVTLDLNGFSIYRTSQDPADGAAIYFGKEVIGAHIFNGHILSGVTYDSLLTNDAFVGSGFLNGITHGAEAPLNTRISRMTVSGCDQSGIFLGYDPSTIVEDCQVRVAGGKGIVAGHVIRSTALICGEDGIDAARDVISSEGQSVGAFGIGITAGGNVMDSRGEANGYDGIYALGNVVNSRGTATGIFGDGINASGNVLNSYGSSLDSYGINAGNNVENSTGITFSDDVNDFSPRAGIRGHIVSYSRGTGNSGYQSGIEAYLAAFSIGSGALFGNNISAIVLMGCYPNFDNSVGAYTQLMPVP